MRLHAPLQCWHESLASARTDPLISLSCTGAVLATTRPVPSGTALFLVLALDSGGVTVEIDAVAVDEDISEGFALRFVDVDARAHAVLEQVLALQPAARHDELSGDSFWEESANGFHETQRFFISPRPNELPGAAAALPEETLSTAERQSTPRAASTARAPLPKAAWLDVPESGAHSAVEHTMRWPVARPLVEDAPMESAVPAAVEREATMEQPAMLLSTKIDDGHVDWVKEVDRRDLLAASSMPRVHTPQPPQLGSPGSTQPYLTLKGAESAVREATNALMPLAELSAQGFDEAIRAAIAPFDALIEGPADDLAFEAFEAALRAELAPEATSSAAPSSLLRGADLDLAWPDESALIDWPSDDLAFQAVQTSPTMATPERVASWQLGEERAIMSPTPELDDEDMPVVVGHALPVVVEDQDPFAGIEWTVGEPAKK